MSHVPGFGFFERHREYGAVFVRLVVGFILVYGTQDNVFSHERMLEFRDFLAARRVPLPLFAAYRVMHISNGGYAPRNPGLNVGAAVLGVQLRSATPRRR